MINFNNTINELSAPYAMDFMKFQKDTLKKKGQKYLDDMREDIAEAMMSDWFNRDHEGRGKVLADVIAQYPEFVEYMQDALKKKNGNKITLYRSLTLYASPDNDKVYAKRRLYVPKFINNTTVMLTSYEGIDYFSWTSNKMSTTHAMIVLKADIPIDDVLWAGPVFFSAATRTWLNKTGDQRFRGEHWFADKIVAFEFIAKHDANEKIEAKVIKSPYVKRFERDGMMCVENDDGEVYQIAPYDEWMEWSKSK